MSGRLADLKRYNGLNVYADFFDAAMDRLRTKYLNVSLDTVLHPASKAAKAAARAQQRTAAGAPAVHVDALAASAWFERALAAVDIDEKIRCYTEAIRLKPDDVDVYTSRGHVLKEQGDLAGALADYTEAIRLKPDDVDAYTEPRPCPERAGRSGGRARRLHRGASGLKPDDIYAHTSRGDALKEQGDLAGALADYTEAIRLKPDDVTRTPAAAMS